MRRAAIIGGMLAAAASAMNMGGYPITLPRRPEIVNAPKENRKDRIKRDRRQGSLPKRKIRALNLGRVIHERGKDGRTACGFSIDMLPSNHDIGGPVMCNKCQRARWAADMKDQSNGLVRKHRRSAA